MFSGGESTNGARREPRFFVTAANGGVHGKIEEQPTSERLFFIPPSENPGLSSPGMNDTTSTERALALA